MFDIRIAFKSLFEIAESSNYVQFRGGPRRPGGRAIPVSPWHWHRAPLAMPRKIGGRLSTVNSIALWFEPTA